jgi:hypothetical protein
MSDVFLGVLLACSSGGSKGGHGGPSDDTSTGTDTGTPRPPEGAELASLTLSQATLAPPFRPSQRHYTVAAEALSDSLTTITATPADEGATVAIVQATMDGVPVTAGTSPLEAPFASAERVDITVTLGAEREVYSIVSLPSPFPTIDVRVANESAWDGYLFIGDIPNVAGGVTKDTSQILILDSAGVPVWFRQVAGPGTDLKVHPNGELTYAGLVGDGSGAFAEFVLDDDYQTVATYQPVGGPRLDHRELKILPDGNAIVLGFVPRKADLSKYGHPGCCVVRDGVLQELDPERNVVFEWRTADFFDELWADLSEQRRANAEDGFDYVHVNSIEIDPDDGNWIVSARFTSHVLKIARHETTFHGVVYEPGEIVWKLGGPTSDWTFVGDERRAGWHGFAEQHDARMPSPNHLTVYDNSFWEDVGVTGDSRYVEYELDPDAMTATKVNEYAIVGAGDTGICGSAARLPNGSTVIGWGNLSNSYPQAPAVSEVTEDGHVVLELGFSSDLLSFRAGVGSWDPKTGWSVAR